MDFLDCKKDCKNCIISCLTLEDSHSNIPDRDEYLYRVLYVKSTGELLLNLRLTPIKIEQIMECMVPGVGTIMAIKEPREFFVSTIILVMMRPPTEIYDSIRKLETLARSIVEGRTQELYHTPNGTLH